jgi:hypothetical protein
VGRTGGGYGLFKKKKWKSWLIEKESSLKE